MRRNGSVKAIEGRARVRDTTTDAKLQVTFLRLGTSWIFVPGGAYWIIGLDPDYRWAVVGSPDRSSGFVLSRTRTLPLGDRLRIRSVLKRNGYDPADFKRTPQSSGQLSPVWTSPAKPRRPRQGSQVGASAPAHAPPRRAPRFGVRGGDAARGTLRVPAHPRAAESNHRRHPPRLQ